MIDLCLSDIVKSKFIGNDINLCAIMNKADALEIGSDSCFMKIIVCLDDCNGMMFNHRRLSQDVMMRRDIFESINGGKLFMNSYSYQMFKDDEFMKNIHVEESVPILNDEYQFIEDKPLIHYAHDIQQIVIYYWNRRYPSDLQFDIDIDDGNWRLLLEEEIVGNSHNKITKKIFGRIIEG